MRKFYLLVLLLLLSTVSYAQDSNQVRTDNQFWTLPSTECDGDNFCEVRISPQGTIYGWENIHRKLYASQPNQSTYTTYDLSGYSDYLGFGTDFVPFDTEGYIIFFSSFGGFSNQLIRYDVVTGQIQEIVFPDAHRLIACNRYSALKQRVLKNILQLGLSNNFAACTYSPEDRRVIIHIIDVNTLTIEQRLDIHAGLDESATPSWFIAMGGLDNKIYAVVRNPEAVIANLPQIDELTQEIVLIYDVSNEVWEYRVWQRGNAYSFLAANEGIFFADSTSQGRDMIQVDSNFQRIRRLPYLGAFQGISTNGDMFFSTGTNYSDIRIIKVHDYPLLPNPSLSQIITFIRSLLME
jgi:hypothetical protein